MVLGDGTVENDPVIVVTFLGMGCADIGVKVSEVLLGGDSQWPIPRRRLFACIGDSYYEHLQALEEMSQEVGASSSPALQP